MRKQKQSILLNWARPFTGNRFASSAFDTSQRAMVAVEVEKVYTEEAKTRMLAGKAIADPIANLPDLNCQSRSLTVLLHLGRGSVGFDLRAYGQQATLNS